MVLARFAREVAAGLRRPLPAPRFAGSIDGPAEADALIGLAEDLERALAGVTADVRENETTLTARDAALAEHDALFSRVAGALSALFDLAGEPELADRVRPSARRPGRLEAEEITS